MNPVTPLLTNAIDEQKPAVELNVASTAATPRTSAGTDLRDVAAAELSAFFTDETGRHESPDNEWRRTIASAREVLAGLERSCEATDERLRQKRAKAAAWVSSLVEKLVTAATAETEAAVKRTRAEAEVDIQQMQALVAHMRTESDALREEIARLQQRLETEKSRSAQLAAAFDAIQRAIALVEPVEPPAQVTSSAPETPEPPQAAADTNRQTMAQPAAASNPLLAEYVKQLLDQIESIYWTDLGAAMGPADIVGRLTENLRYARDVFGRRVSTANASETALFEQQLTTLLDSKSETSFGRHLAIAAYSYARPKFS